MTTTVITGVGYESIITKLSGLKAYAYEPTGPDFISRLLFFSIETNKSSPWLLKGRHFELSIVLSPGLHTSQ